MKKQPEQTTRTRQGMIDAFWELAAKQGIDKVTISAITKKPALIVELSMRILRT